MIQKTINTAIAIGLISASSVYTQAMEEERIQLDSDVGSLQGQHLEDPLLGESELPADQMERALQHKEASQTFDMDKKDDVEKFKIIFLKIMAGKKISPITLQIESEESLKNLLGIVDQNPVSRDIMKEMPIAIYFCNLSVFDDAILQGVLELFPKVRELNLDFARFTDNGYAHLRNLENLTKLVLSRTQITDEGLKNIAGLIKLESLNLWGASKITDNGLFHLQNLINLTELDLASTNTTNVGVSYIVGLKNLKSLNLWNVRQISDDGVAYLRYLINLTNLDLFNTQITNNGLPYVGALTNLKSLSLRDAVNVTDEGLGTLKDFKSLTKLDLRDTGITIGAVKEFVSYEKRVGDCRGIIDGISEKSSILFGQDEKSNIIISFEYTAVKEILAKATQKLAKCLGQNEDDYLNLEQFMRHLTHKLSKVLNDEQLAFVGNPLKIYKSQEFSEGLPDLEVDY